MTDVIEIGDDGTFEVPSEQVRQSTRIQIEEDSDDESPEEINQNVEISSFLNNAQDIIESGYKIYQSPTDVIIIIKGKDKEQPKNCFFNADKISLVTNFNRTLAVPIPDGIAPKGKKICTCYDNIFVVKLELE